MEHRKDSAPCCPRRHHITYTFVLHQPKSLCVCVCLSHTHRYTHTQTSPIFIAQSEKNAGNGWKFTTLWKEGQVERTPTHAYTQPPNTTQTHKHKNKYSYRVIYLYQHLQFKRFSFHVCPFLGFKNKQNSKMHFFYLILELNHLTHSISRIYRIFKKWRLNVVSWRW